MSAPVKTIVAPERMDRLFKIGPDQPDLHARLLVGLRIGKCEKNRRARCAVVRADKSGLKQSVIMPCEDKYVLLRITRDVEFANDVMDRDWAARRGGSKIVGFHLPTVPLQDLMDEVFCLF